MPIVIKHILAVEDNESIKKSIVQTQSIENYAGLGNISDHLLLVRDRMIFGRLSFQTKSWTTLVH